MDCCPCSRSLGPPLIDGQDDDALNDTIQAQLQNLMNVATLLMGFIITGALISISFSPDANFTQRDTLLFVGNAFTAFMWALLAFFLSMALSLVGGQLRTYRGCRRNSTRFLVSFTFLTLIAECSIYLCASSLLDFLNRYIDLNYIAPSRELCPGSTASFETTNTFCALVGDDFYAEAVQKCGPANVSNIRNYIQGDEHALICNGLDQYASDPDTCNSTSWFAWYVPSKISALLHRTKTMRVTEQRYIEHFAKVLGEDMCGKGTAEIVKDLACGQDTISVNCSTALLAYNEADDCAGQKYEDVLMCHRTCSWSLPFSVKNFVFGRDETQKKMPIAEAFEAIPRLTSKLQAVLWTWMVLRIIIFFGIACYNRGRMHCYSDDYEDEDEYENITHGNQSDDPNDPIPRQAQSREVFSPMSERYLAVV